MELGGKGITWAPPLTGTPSQNQITRALYRPNPPLDAVGNPMVLVAEFSKAVTLFEKHQKTAGIVEGRAYQSASSPPFEPNPTWNYTVYANHRVPAEASRKSTRKTTSLRKNLDDRYNDDDLDEYVTEDEEEDTSDEPSERASSADEGSPERVDAKCTHPAYRGRHGLPQHRENFGMRQLEARRRKEAALQQRRKDEALRRFAHPRRPTGPTDP